MEIEIKPDDIDKYIKDAIIKSSIGKNVIDAINKAIKDLFGGYNNPIERFVSEEIKIMVNQYMNSEDIKPKILEAIAKGLAPETITLIVSNAAYDLQKKINDKSYDP